MLSPFHDQGVGAVVATAARRDRDPPRDSDYVFVTQLVGDDESDRDKLVELLTDDEIRAYWPAMGDR